jgi:SAM-dependent methyltransferase
MRWLRRSIPQGAIEWMLDRGLFLKPGLDTRAPEQSVEQLAAICAQHGQTLEGRVVCVVGYGGSFGIGLALLQRGARHVVLQDPFAPLRPSRIQQLDPAQLQRYFRKNGGAWLPNQEHITIINDPLDAYVRQHPASVDIVFSSSVFEHVDEVDRLTRACSALVKPDGLNVHSIDLRDHYFTYPFEMLCYERRTWERWLNSSNLNRLRYSEYESTFRKHFGWQKITVTESLPAQFKQVRDRIRPEFLSGDDAIDSVGVIRVEARKAA